MSDVDADDIGDPLASIGQRIGARLLDWVLLLVIWIPIVAVSSERVGEDVVTPKWAIVLWMVIVVLYEVGFVAWSGQTIGKRALGIRLVSLQDGRILSLPAAVTRVLPIAVAMPLLEIFFPIVMVFVYFSAAFMKHTRGVLDLMAGSVVIQARN